MTPEQFRRIEILFNAAIATPPEEWQAFLDTHEADTATRATVFRMLSRLQDSSGDPVDMQLQRVAVSATLPTPHYVGTYRLLKQLGNGGMGTVHLAERELAGSVQRVAIKVLHGLPSATNKRRIARERELLAGLNHPNIAGLIDSGESATGQPYLVMNYVEGMALGDYLAAHAMGLSDRIRLFQQCCHAVQHAHQRLVLHRDVKPSNVIVSTEGTPVLLDFGIGTLLAGELSEARTTTSAFTPGYAAPEQLQGTAATTATDVFGLGAVLFDILTGLRLSDRRGAGMPVPLPSSQPIDGISNRHLRGDLDRIVMKATSVDPEARYSTAAALSEDLDRYLQGKPVLAAPDSRVYRLCKFIHRRRWSVCTVLILVCVGAAFVWQLNAERKRALVAEASAARESRNALASRDFLVSVLGASDPEVGRGNPITVSTLLAAATAELRQGTGQDAATRASAWLTVADVYRSLGDPGPGLQAVDAAALSLKQAGNDDPETQARFLEARGVLLGQLERFDEAQQTLMSLIALRSGQHGHAADQARALRELATVFTLQGKREQAEHTLKNALSLLEGGSGEKQSALRLDLMLDLTRLYGNRPGEMRSAAYLSDAMTLASTVLASDDPRWRIVHQTAGMVNRALGRYPAALDHARQALSVARRVYGNDSQHTMDQESELAMVLGQLGRYREAVEHLQRARDIRQTLALGPLLLAQQDIQLSWLYEGMGDNERAVDLLDTTLAALPNEPAYDTWRWVAYKQRGSAHGELRHYALAWPDFRQSLALARADRGAESLEHAQIQARYAQVLIDAGLLQQAQSTLDTARRVSMAFDAAAYAPVWIRFAELDAQLAQARGDRELAKHHMEHALALAAKQPEADPVKLAKVKLLAAEISFQQHDRRHARAYLHEAQPVLEGALSAHSHQLTKARWLAGALDNDIALTR